MARRLDFHSANFAADFDALLDSKREADSDVHVSVASIIADIRNHGDQALLALTAKFDNLHATTVADLAVGRDEMAAALHSLDSDLRAHWNWLPTGFAVFTKNNCLKIFPIKMMLVFSLVCALRRLMRRVFMCRVARLPTHHRF